MSSTSMEEIPLEDVDSNGVEYKVLMAYAQRRLSASKFGHLLEREAKSREVLSQGGEELPENDQASKGQTGQELSTKEQEHRPKNKKQRKKKSLWKCWLLPSCVKAGKPYRMKDTTNGPAQRESPAGVGGQLSYLEAEENSSTIAHVADRLAEIVNANSLVVLQGGKFRGLIRTPSLEEDGGQSKAFHQDDKDEEQRIIGTIVALLRQSGDELEEKMQRDKTFCQRVTEMLSYSFFKKVADQFLENIQVNPAKKSETKIQSTKVAFTLEVTTRLTAVDNHPMNMVLGFGTKYLKENFSPWIQNQGGWEKALGLSDQEEVE
uniref:BCL2 like 14 n=1 Tax=Sphenodon punctatus TaxID=8508 RepID=A0A8D0HTG1_SPHPU